MSRQLPVRPDLDHLRKQDEARAELVPSPQGEPVPPSVPVPFSDSARRILRSAVEQADSSRHTAIGLAHLIAGVLCHEESGAASVLAARGLTRQAFARELDAMLGEETP
jgi:ATP-dependent Clp protease ATP-binding subunit ClpA